MSTDLLPSDLLSKQDPIRWLAADRAKAREQKDGWAAICALGTVNDEGDAEQRTLVLRETQNRLSLFFSATSPKWRELQQRPTASVFIYLPSTQVQYRLRVRWERIDDSVVRESWQFRPDIPKKLDWLYQTHGQSTELDRTLLEASLAEETPTPAEAPETAIGVFLNPVRVERLELSSGVHQRDLFELTGNDWRHRSLVP